MSTLTREDKAGPCWQKIKKFLETRLQNARLLNDTDKDERKTAHLRGRIAEIKQLLTLGDEIQQIAPDDFKD